MCRPKGRVFEPLWSENGYRFCSVWTEIGYGFQGNSTQESLSGAPNENIVQNHLFFKPGAHPA